MKKNVQALLYQKFLLEQSLKDKSKGSQAQRYVWRKALRKVNKQLEQFTKPTAKPRPLPPAHYQKTLFTNH